MTVVLCKCGWEMEPKKEKKDGYFRYFWKCPNPDCGREEDFGARQPKDKRKRQ